jgi:hypothetical protein
MAIDVRKMTLAQISNLISSNNDETKLLHTKLNELGNQNKYLLEVKELRIIELFSEYIQIGGKYDVTSYMYLTGIQTGLVKPTTPTKPIPKRPNFVDGDVIEFTKRNKKSIVITCLTKNDHSYANGAKTVKTHNPNWTFRIDTDSLYHQLTREPDFKQRFEAYVRRSEALELLGV